VEDFVETLTRGNPGSVKAVLASVVLAIKVTVIRSGRGGRALPYLGVSLFALLAVTWLTVTPDFLAGED
jgi:hypothetical protein